MIHSIRVGSYRLGMIEKVSVHQSVELLADTATLTLPGMEYGKALEVEQKISRGDEVSIAFGYKEYGVPQEFKGYVQNLSVKSGSITLQCEDELFKFRQSLPNKEYVKIKLDALLQEVIAGIGQSYDLDCSYAWSYDKFVVNNLTGYDVLKKVQEEVGADIYLSDKTLHVHAPEEKTGPTVRYDFAQNIEKENLTYRRSEEKKVKVVVKSMQPDGSVQQVESGNEGGEKVEIVCPPSDVSSMKLRSESEVKQRSFDGYTGSIETWLVPRVKPGYKAELTDVEYPEKRGTYFVKSVTTEFSKAGGVRKVELGRRLS